MSVELDNIIIYILVAVSVAFIVHLLFKNLRKDDMTVVRMNVAENKTGKYDSGMEELTIRTKFPEYKFVDYDEPHRFDSPKESGKCAVPLNGDNDLDFLMKTMSGEHDTCPKQVKTRKQFFNDFMGFRNLTEINSSERDDPVDKIQQLIIDGNLGQTDRRPNMKIRDLFDAITDGPNLYKKQCIRTPTFDDINFDGYYMSAGAHPMQMTRDEWSYPNEKVMNGGQIRSGLVGHDPNEISQKAYTKN